MKYSQQESLSKEIQILRDEKSLSGNSKLSGLYHELKDGVLVLTGNVCQPAILSPEHKFTNYHEKFQHSGIELVLNELRQKYWVIHIHEDCVYQMSQMQN